MTHFLYWTQEDSHSQAEDWGEPDCKMLFHGNMTEILMKGSQLSRAVSSYVPWRYSPLADILSVWRREKNPFLLAYYTSDKGQGLSEVVTHTTTEVGYVILKLFSSNFFLQVWGTDDFVLVFQCDQYGKFHFHYEFSTLNPSLT